MTKSADTLDSDEVAGGCTAVAQRVEHSDAGAEQWRRLGITQTFRYRHNSLHRSHHILLVSPVVADARNFQVLAVAKISSLARSAGPIVSAMPTHTDTLSLLPVGHTVTKFVNDADDFMPRDAGILNSGPTAFFRE